MCVCVCVCMCVCVQGQADNPKINAIVLLKGPVSEQGEWAL